MPCLINQHHIMCTLRNHRCRPAVASAVALLLCISTPSIPAVDADDHHDSDDVCAAGDGGGAGSCGLSTTTRSSSLSNISSTAGPLRWRYAHYDRPVTGAYGGDLVHSAFEDAGFTAVADDDWDVLFTHFPVKHSRLDALNRSGLDGGRPRRLVNHCQYFTAAGQKCILADHIVRVARELGHERPPLDKHLETYVLADPQQAAAWMEALRRDPSRHWLLKDCSGGASQGIDLVNSWNESMINESIGKWRVAQAYMSNPLTSHRGQKFHVRLYVLITSWAPVHAWVYEDGLVFRSKHAHVGDRPSAERDIFSAFSTDVDVLALSALWEELGSSSTQKAQASISELLAEVLGSSLEASFGDPRALESERGYSCFDLFGVNVMFDQQVRPYILEVNMGPNLWVDRQGKEIEAMLRMVKTPLVRQIVAWAEATVRHSAAVVPMSAAPSSSSSDSSAEKVYGLNVTAEESLLVGFHRILPPS